MAKELKVYHVKINGMATTVKLSAEAAERYGLTEKDLVASKAAPKPANKSRTAANKSDS